MRSIPRPLLPLIALLFLVSGCSAISALGDASQPLEVYELRAPDVRKAAVQRDIELVVEEPASSGSLSTERIMIRPTRLQAQYLPGVRWADIAPVMVQTLMVRSLTATGAFRSVGRLPIGTAADYALLSELTDFQAETNSDGESAVIRVRIIFRIVRESDARVVGTRAFTATEQANATDVNTIVDAFDRATSNMLEAAIGWIISDTPAFISG